VISWWQAGDIPNPEFDPVGNDLIIILLLVVVVNDYLTG
jgi:hypothetical protein